MKKILLICAFCLVVLGRFWLLSVLDKPCDASSAIEFGNVSITDSSYDSTQKADAKKDTKTNTKTTNTTETQRVRVIGCGASFSSENTARMVNGETVSRYIGKKVITCKCDTDGDVFEKTVTYQYSAEPKDVDLDCDSKCGEICANN
ncbi:MAG: hypothetical protein J5613_00865 [Alphaproteobacteria bacterium]|nr:hypothetical protein [Alphaproteobacteria bacterium]MBR4806696.1 hypothetical protein [Alphaproteobacteria bacterium]